MRPIGVQLLACQSRSIAWISLGRPLKTLSSVRPGLTEFTVIRAAPARPRSSARGTPSPPSPMIARTPRAVRACYAHGRPYDIITFDCYGTLIDWEAGIADAFRDAAAADGVRLDPAAAQRALREKEPESQAAAYRSYRDVLTETAMVVADKLGWKLSRARAAF